MPWRDLTGVYAAASAGDSGGAKGLVSAEELQALQERLSKTADELSNAQQDVSRLQCEKQEAEAAGGGSVGYVSGGLTVQWAGKAFHEKLRVLQREVEVERSRSSAATAESEASFTAQQMAQSHLQSELEVSRAAEEALRGRVQELEEALVAAQKTTSAAEVSTVTGGVQCSVLIAAVYCVVSRPGRDRPMVLL